MQVFVWIRLQIRMLKGKNFFSRKGDVMKDHVGDVFVTINHALEVKDVLGMCGLEKVAIIWVLGGMKKHREGGKTIFFLFCNSPESFETSFKKVLKTNHPKQISFQYGSEKGMLCQEFALRLMLMEESKKVEVYLFETVVLDKILEEEEFCRWLVEELSGLYLFDVLGCDAKKIWEELEKCQITNTSKLIEKYRNLK